MCMCSPVEIHHFSMKNKPSEQRHNRAASFTDFPVAVMARFFWYFFYWDLEPSVAGNGGSGSPTNGGWQRLDEETSLVVFRHFTAKIIVGIETGGLFWEFFDESNFDSHRKERREGGDADDGGKRAVAMIDFMCHANTDLLVAFHCDRQVSHSYKYKFLRATTSNIPSSVIRDNRGSKLTIGRGGMLKVQHLVSVAKPAIPHPHVDSSGYQQPSRIAYIEFFVKPERKKRLNTSKLRKFKIERILTEDSSTASTKKQIDELVSQDRTLQFMKFGVRSQVLYICARLYDLIKDLDIDSYKYKFLRATTSNIPSSVIRDNRGSKLTIGRGGMLKVQHLVSVAKPAIPHPHVDSSGYQQPSRIAYIEFFVKPEVDDADNANDT
ncbi:hypothetical protein BC332_00715 [Capsicum chinense]|nr:hypothetical protein BC332_00715 [Capsicum chinense]